MNKNTLRRLYEAWIETPECTDEGTRAWIAFLDETIRQGMSTSQALERIHVIDQFGNYEMIEQD